MTHHFETMVETIVGGLLEGEHPASDYEPIRLSIFQGKPVGVPIDNPQSLLVFRGKQVKEKHGPKEVCSLHGVFLHMDFWRGNIFPHVEKGPLLGDPCCFCWREGAALQVAKDTLGLRPQPSKPLYKMALAQRLGFTSAEVGGSRCPGREVPRTALGSCFRTTPKSP